MTKIIVDANVMSKCVAGDPDAVPIIERLLSKALKLSIGGTKLRSEYRAHPQFVTKILLEVQRIGGVIDVNDEGVDAEQGAVALLALSSDDPHIIALARVGGARILYSEDRALHTDFKDLRLVPRPKGKIYHTAASHLHLLP